ncbi:MAG: hypothetical protein HY235_30195, partial [Acidobacteria bacterium]|nr:hypothetical protein [Acidobacteriota bacterium]
MRHSTVPARILRTLAVNAALCQAQLALGQSTAADIVGIVRDATGAV